MTQQQLKQIGHTNSRITAKHYFSFKQLKHGTLEELSCMRREDR